MTVADSVRERLTAARAVSGLSNVEIAKRCKASTSTVSRFFLGTFCVSATAVQEIAAALDVVIPRPKPVGDDVARSAARKAGASAARTRPHAREIVVLRENPYSKNTTLRRAWAAGVRHERMVIRRNNTSSLAFHASRMTRYDEGW